MIYGDAATITAAQNDAIRRVIAAIRHLAPPDGYLPDTAKAQDHLDAAIAEIERAERAATHTDTPTPAGGAEAEGTIRSQPGKVSSHGGKVSS